MTVTTCTFAERLHTCYSVGMRHDWEPAPFELPLEAPRQAPRDWSQKSDDPLVDDRSDDEDSDAPSGVIVIDLA